MYVYIYIYIYIYIYYIYIRRRKVEWFSSYHLWRSCGLALTSEVHVRLHANFSLCIFRWPTATLSSYIYIYIYILNKLVVDGNIIKIGRKAATPDWVNIITTRSFVHSNQVDTWRHWENSRTWHTIKRTRETKENGSNMRGEQRLFPDA